MNISIVTDFGLDLHDFTLKIKGLPLMTPFSNHHFF